MAVQRVIVETDDGMRIEVTKNGVFFGSGGHIESSDAALINNIHSTLVSQDTYKIMIQEIRKAQDDSD